MTLFIERTYAEDHVVLPNLQRSPIYISDAFRVLPVWSAGCAPQNLIGSRSSVGRGIPSQRRIVLQVFGQHVNVCRRRRGRCQGRQCGRVQSGHMRDVVEVNELGQVPEFDAFVRANVLMLVMEVFPIFGETYGSESLLVK